VEIASKAIELYTKREIWMKAQQHGFVITNQLYDKEKLGFRLIDRITELQENLDQHRAQNFMGVLLQYHTLQSTKYLGKWIEAKNS